MNRVLIVDDDQAILYVVSAMIERIGFIPTTTTTAIQALQIFKTEKPGIVLADLNLGGEMDGVALCSRVRYEDNSTAVIAMSGHFSTYDKAYCLAAGFSDFLEKPMDMQELNSALQCAFERRSRWMNLP